MTRGMGMLLRNDESILGVFDIADDGMILLDRGLENYIQKFVYEDDRETITVFASNAVLHADAVADFLQRLYAFLKPCFIFFQYGCCYPVKS